MFVLALLTSAHADPCATRTTTSEVTVYLRSANEAYAARDLNRFRDSLDSAFARIECLSDPISADMAASLHRLSGLQAMSDLDEPIAQRFFAASRVANPDFSFPETLFPPADPIRATFNAIDLDSQVTIKVPKTASGSIRLDGQQRALRYESLPTLFQFVTEKGKVVHSSLVDSGKALPILPEMKVSVPKPGGGKATPKQKRLRLISAGVMGVGAATVATAVGLGKDANCIDGTTCYSPGRAGLKNTLFWTGAGTIVLGGTLFAGSF